MGNEDPIEIEEFACSTRPVPKGRRYRIRVDRGHFVVDSPIVGRDVLALVGKSPNQWDLILKLRPRGQRVIGPDEPVDLTEPGVERFVTMKRQVTDGEEVPLRRQVTLRAADTDFLESLGGGWEALREGNTTRVLIPGVDLPRGLRASTGAWEGPVWMALTLPGTYPDTQIDMAAFFPPLAREDQRPIPSVSNLRVDGRIWQQWSRHRPDPKSWRSEVDGIDTHVAFVLSWLDREVSR